MRARKSFCRTFEGRDVVAPKAEASEPTIISYAAGCSVRASFVSMKPRRGGPCEAIFRDE